MYKMVLIMICQVYEKNYEISCKVITHPKYLLAGKLYTKHQKH